MTVTASCSRAGEDPCGDAAEQGGSDQVFGEAARGGNETEKSEKSGTAIVEGRSVEAAVRRREISRGRRRRNQGRRSSALTGVGEHSKSV